MFNNFRSSSMRSSSKLLLVSILVIFASFDHVTSADSGGYGGGGGGGTAVVVKRNQREAIVQSEYGEISRVRLGDGNQSYQIQFFTLEPNSLLLPVLLHEDMVFYVHSGSGVLSYLDVDENEKENRELRRGDIHRLRAGSVFFLQSDLEDPERQKLRLHAIFGNSGPDFSGASFEPYSSIRDVVLGFDKKVLQQIFEVPEEVIEEVTREPKPAAIIQANPRKEKTLWEKEQQYLADIIGGNLFHFSNKHKKSKLYNIFGDKPDFQNCNGWSTTVNRKKYSPLKHSQFGIFMVNLTTGSMMGPHWNPTATEIAVVLQGKGMVRVVCSSGLTDKECKNTIINVEEGDAFVVPRYHPMAHMAFNNETFVFVGFSTATKKNHPQFLAGEASVLRTLDKGIVARSFGVGDATIDRLLVNQGESVILKCVSCAEEEWRSMVEEMEREREEERKREEEEARRKEEEARREEEERRRKEEEVKKREEQEREEREKREEEEREAREREEAARREEEEREAEERRRREEEEAKKREEEAARQREQEEREAREREEAARREREEQEADERRRKQEEEEAKKREEEAERQREQEEKEAREREEAERREREEQEAEERRKKQEEEEAARQREQEEKEAREREEAERRESEKQEAEERRRKQEEKEAKKRKEEEEAARQREQEEIKAREREEAEERQRQQEQEQQQEAQKREEAAEREKEEEEKRQAREREERRREQQRQQEQQREAEAKREEEAARREEEEEAPERQEQQPRGKAEQQEEEEAAQMQERGRRRGGKGEHKTSVDHKGSSGRGMRKTV